MLKKIDLLKTQEYWVNRIQDILFEKVQNYLKDNNISRVKFANDLGVSKGYVSQVLNGQFNFSLKKLVELSLAIGKVPDIHFDEVDNYIRKVLDEDKKLHYNKIIPIRSIEVSSSDSSSIKVSEEKYFITSNMNSHNTKLAS